MDKKTMQYSIILAVAIVLLAGGSYLISSLNSKPNTPRNEEKVEDNNQENDNDSDKDNDGNNLEEENNTTKPNENQSEPDYDDPTENLLEVMNVKIKNQPYNLFNCSSKAKKCIFDVEGFGTIVYETKTAQAIYVEHYLYINDKLIAKTNEFDKFDKIYNINGGVIITQMEAMSALNANKVFGFNKQGEEVFEFEGGNLKGLFNTLEVTDEARLSNNKFVGKMTNVVNSETFGPYFILPCTFNGEKFCNEETISVEICNFDASNPHKISDNFVISQEYEIEYLGNGKFSSPKKISGSEVTIKDYQNKFCN